MNDPSQVDRLLPPASGPTPVGVSSVEFHVRVSQSLRRGHWWRDRIAEAPCWLASMFFHLVFVVVIGSMTPPPAVVRGIDLTLRSDESDQSRDEGQPATIEIQQDDNQSVDDEGNDGENGDMTDPVEDEPEPAEPEEPMEEEPAAEPMEQDDNEEDPMDPAEEPMEEAPEETTPELADTADVPEEPEIKAPLQPLSDEPSELLDNLVPVSAFAPRAAWAPLSWVHAAPIRPELKQVTVSDEKVNRFIEYDLGNLRGDPGKRARREFEQMGPSAIPALVRGLNKSASIQASCPVGVISTRLTRELKQCDDPAMIRYALENIGRGVPVEAPHYLRVESLQARLRDHFTEQDKRFQRILSARQTPVSAEMLGRLNQLGNGKYEDLLASLEAEDERSRITAIIAVEVADPRLTRPQRHELARRLVQEIRIGTERTKRHAHYSLAALAHRYLTDPPQEYTTDPQLADDWQNAWKARETDTTTQQARSLYTQASRFERLGQIRTAQSMYNQLASRYPNTQYGTLAKQKAAGLSREPYAESLYRLATTLHELGRTDAALQRFRDLVRKYPETPAALKAVRMIEQLEKSGGGAAAEPLKGKIESAFDAF